MATTIKLKNSVTATNAPSSLVQGEVAINVTDKKVWVGNAATTPVQLLGTGADGNFSALTCTTLAASGVATFSAGTVSAPAITTTGDTNTGIFFPAADTIAFTEGGTEAMRIDTSGNLLVGTTSQLQAGKFCIQANLNDFNAMVINDTSSSTSVAYSYFSRGGVLKGSISYSSVSNLVSYNTTSDYRLKENIITLSNALQTVSQLKPRQYDWKENGVTTTGFIAHELAEVLPHAVNGEKDAVDKEGNPKYQGIDTSFLVATLTAAIQELKAIVDAQAERITVLESK